MDDDFDSFLKELDQPAEGAATAQGISFPADTGELLDFLNSDTPPSVPAADDGSADDFLKDLDPPAPGGDHNPAPSAEQAEAERAASEQTEAEWVVAEQAEAERVAVEQAEAECVAAEQAEAARIASEQAEAEMAAVEQAEAECVAAEQAEAARAASEQAEAERVAAEQAQAERVAAEQAEAARMAQAERIAAEQADAVRIAAEQAEAERVAAEQAEAERVAAEQAEAARMATEQAEAARIASEQAETERLASEQAQVERVAAEQAEAERVAAEQAEAERVAAEQAEAARVAAEQVEAERVAAEQAEAERDSAEQAETERLASEQAEAERDSAEQAEAERVAAEQAEAERVAADQVEAERVAAEQAEVERVAVEQAEAERVAIIGGCGPVEANVRAVSHGDIDEWAAAGDDPDTDEFLFAAGDDLDVDSGDGAGTNESKKDEKNDGCCFFEDFLTEFPLLQQDNHEVVDDLAFKRLSTMAHSSTSHFKDLSEESFFKNLNTLSPPLDALCPTGVRSASGELIYSSAEDIRAVLQRYLSSGQSTEQGRKLISSPSGEEKANVPQSAEGGEQEDVLEMSSFDEDELSLGGPVVGADAVSAPPVLPPSAECGVSDAARAVWCAVKLLEGYGGVVVKEMDISSSESKYSSNYGEDEALAPVGHDATQIAAHQASLVTSPRSKTAKKGSIEISFLPMVQKILLRCEVTVEFSTGVLALITELWARGFEAEAVYSENTRKAKRKEQQQLISSLALDILVEILRSHTVLLEGLVSGDGTVDGSARHVLPVLEQCCVLLVGVCSSTNTNDLSGPTRQKLTGSLHVETWFNRSLSVVCAAKAAGQLAEDKDPYGVNVIERVLSSFCRAGVALCWNHASKCFLVNPAPVQDNGPAESLAFILCTVLALYATSPVVVMWVARLAYSMSCIKPGEGNFVKADPSGSEGPEELPSSVTAALCQSLAASTLTFQGKLLTQRPLFSLTGAIERTGTVNDDTSVEVEAVHLTALHTQYKDYLRYSAVEWGLLAVGSLTFGRKIALYAQPLAAISYGDAVLSVPAVNRQLAEEVNATQAVLDILKGAVFDILDGYAQPEVEGWSKRQAGLENSAEPIIGEVVDDSMSYDNGLRLVAACGWCLNNLCTDNECSVQLCIEGGVCELIGQTLSFLHINVNGKHKELSVAIVRELSIMTCTLAAVDSGILEFEKESSLVLKSLMQLIVQNNRSGKEVMSSKTSNGSDYLWLSVSSLLLSEGMTSVRRKENPWKDDHVADDGVSKLLLQLIHMDPYDVIGEALSTLHTSATTMRVVVRILALLVRAGKAVAVAMVQSALVQPLVNVLAKYVEDVEIAYFGCVAMTGLLAVNAGKKAFLYTSPINGIDVLVIIMTRYMSYGNYNASIIPSTTEEEGHVVLNLQSHSVKLYDEEAASSHGVCIEGPAGGGAGDSSHNVLLAAVTALTHFALIPPNLLCDDSSALSRDSLLVYQFSDALAILYRIGQSGAVKVIPKLLCQSLHDVVTALEASQHVSAIVPARRGKPSLSAPPSSKCFHVDMTLCKWLCRAMGALGGVAIFDNRECISQRRLHNSLLGTTTPYKNVIFDQNVTGNVGKMGMVMEVFEALLILSKYSFELTRLVLARTVSSLEVDSVNLSTSALQLSSAVCTAVTALSVLPENRHRMRTLFLPLISASGAPVPPHHPSNPSGVNIFMVLVGALRLSEEANVHALSELRHGIRNDVSRVISTMYMSEDVSPSAATDSDSHNDGVVLALSTALTHCVEELTTGDGEAPSRVVVNSTCSVVLAVTASAYRHRGNVRRYSGTAAVSEALLALLKVRGGDQGDYDCVTVATLSACISLADVSYFFHTYFLQRGISESIQSLLEARHGHSWNNMIVYQLSEYRSLSTLVVSAAARLIASFTVKLTSDKRCEENCTFYYKMYGNADSSSGTGSLGIVGAPGRQKLYKYFAGRDSLTHGTARQEGGLGKSSEGSVGPAGKLGALRVLSSAGSMILGKASGIYSSMASNQPDSADRIMSSRDSAADNAYDSRGELTFQQIEGLYAADSSYHQDKLTGARAVGRQLVHNEDMDLCDPIEGTELIVGLEECDVAACFLEAGLVEAVVREYKRLPTHADVTKTTDASSWEEQSLLLALYAMAVCDSRLQARLSAQPKLIGCVVASLTNPAYLVHREDVKTRREMEKHDSVGPNSTLKRQFAWKYICVRSRIAVIRHSLYALAALMTNNKDNIEELEQSDIVEGLVHSCPLYLACSEPIAWGYCQFIDAIASESFATATTKLADHVLLILARHLHSPRVCYWGLKALDQLFSNAEVCLGVLKEENRVVDVILEAVRKQGAILSVAQSGCGALRRLVLYDIGAFDLLKRAGVDVITASYQKHSHDPIVVYSCCSILRDLLTGNSLLPVAEEEGNVPFAAVDIVATMSTTDSLNVNTIGRALIPPLERSTLRSELLECGMCEAILDGFVEIPASAGAPLQVSASGEAVVLMLNCLLGLLEQSGDPSRYDGAMNSKSPRQSSDISTINCQERMTQHGVFEILPAILKAHRDEVDVLIAWCNLVGPFIQGNEKYAQKLVQHSDLPETLTSFLRDHGEHAEAVKATCRVINALCLVRDNRIRLGHHGACQAIVGALTTHRSSSLVCSSCLLALGSLTHVAAANVDVVATADMLSSLQQVATDHPMDDSVAWTLCRVISSLQGRSAVLATAGSYALVVLLLQSRLQDQDMNQDTDKAKSEEKAPESVTSKADAARSIAGIDPDLVVEWACRCIGSLAVDTDSRLAFGHAGACEAIVNTLYLYTPTSAYITREAILALSCICDTSGALANIDKLQEQGGQVAVKAIQQYFDDTEVCWCCCKLLISLSIRPGYLVNVSAGDYVISVMQKHYKNSLVTEWGCRALSSLAVDDQYRDILIGDGASDAIVQALTAAVSSESILSFVVQRISGIQNIASKLGIAGGSSFLTKSALGASACNSIFSLADRHDDFRQQLGTAGACESVVKVLVKFSSESSDVAGAACQAIVSLCRDSPLNRGRVGAAGGCKAVINVLKNYATDETVAVHALCCLVALIPDSTYMEVSGEFSNARGEAVCRYDERKVRTNASTNGALFEDSTMLKLSMRSEEADKQYSPTIFEANIENRKPNLAKFATNESCEAVALVLQSHQSSERVANVGCWTVALLANSDEDVLSKLSTVGACESTVSMLQRQLRSPTVCRSGCIALARLAVNPGNSGWLGAAGGCNVALDAAKQHPNNYTVCWTAWAAITSLSFDDGNRSRFGLLKAVECVIDSLSRYTRTLDELYSSRGASPDADAQMETQGTGGKMSENSVLSEGQSTREVDREADEICLVCEECCHALSLLSRDKENMQRMTALSAANVIVKILLTPHITPGLCAMALGALTSLVSSSVAAKDALCEAGACDAIVVALKRHAVIEGGDAYVSIQGAISMYSLSHRHCNNQTLLGAAGGCEVLLSLLRRYGWTESVTEHVCRAINAIILDHLDNQIRMANAAACSVILGAMKVHFSSATAVNRAACALFNLAVDNEVCREQCCAGEGCSILEACLHRHLSNEAVCVRVALVIKTLTFDVEGQNKLSQTGVCKLLVKALNVHEASPTGSPLLLSVIAAIVLSHKRNQGLVNASGGCKAIVSACQRHLRDEGVVIEACRALLALGDENEDCKTKLASVGAAELASLILRTYDTPSARKERREAAESNQAGDEGDLYTEVIELATACSGMLAGRAPSSFFSRQFGF